MKSAPCLRSFAVTRVQAATVPALLVLACLGLASSVSALPLTIELAGEVLAVSDPSGLLGDEIAAGAAVSGRYSYDTGLPDIDPHPLVGVYQPSPATYGISLEIEGFTFRTDPLASTYWLKMENDLGSPNVTVDGYSVKDVNSWFDPAPTDVVLNTIHWRLRDPVAQALDSTDLPADAPVLADWPQNLLSLSSLAASGSFGVECRVSSARVVTVPVPEPGSGSLLGLAFLGLGLAHASVRRRRHRR